MKSVLSLVIAGCVAGSFAFAQQPAPGPTTLAVGLQRAYANIKRNLTEGAEKMPEADYNFNPNPKMAEMRTFGQLFGHVANSQFGQCATAKGVPNPNQGNDNEKKATKAEFVKALADSFAFCDDAFASLTDATAVQMVTQGKNEIARGVVLSGLVAHGNEMYGTSNVYMRLKGLIPPSTERQGQRGRGGN